MEIDLEKVAEGLRRRGIVSNDEIHFSKNWEIALVEILEDEFDFETNLIQMLEARIMN